MGRSQQNRRWRKKARRWAGISVLGLTFGGLVTGLVVATARQIRVSERNARAFSLTGLPGLEPFAEEERRRALDLAARRFCPAGDGYTVAACLAYNPFCLQRRRNLRWIKAVARSSGASSEETAVREEAK